MKVVKYGKLVDSEHLQLTDALIEASKKEPFWKVTEKVIDLWKKRQPERWGAFLVHLEGVKASQKRKSGLWGREDWRGISKDKKYGIERKHLVDFPIWIYMCLKKLYPDRDLNSKEFFREFGVRFPLFRIFERSRG